MFPLSPPPAPTPPPFQLSPLAMAWKVADRQPARLRFPRPSSLDTSLPRTESIVPGPVPQCALAQGVVPAAPLPPAPTLKRPPPSAAKQPSKRTAFSAKEYDLPPDLGELIHRDVDLIRDKGWETFVKEQQGRGDMTSLDQLNSHPARRFLKMYKHQGLPVKFSIPKWSRSKVVAAL